MTEPARVVLKSMILAGKRVIRALGSLETSSLPLMPMAVMRSDIFTQLSRPLARRRRGLRHPCTRCVL